MINSTQLKLLRGPATFWAGVKWIFSHPKYLWLGLLPAFGSAFVLGLGVLLVILLSGAFAALFAPLTAGLWPWLATAIGAALQLGLIAGGAVLAYVLFVGVALALGDPIYARITKEVELESGHLLSDSPWSAGVKDALLLVAKGALVGFMAFLLGLIPFIGGFLGLVLTWSLLPFLLSEELLGRTLIPQGYFAGTKTMLLSRDGAVTWSFGIVAQLLFTIPLVSLLVMPASVAGAALLAREFLETKDAENTENSPVVHHSD